MTPEAQRAWAEEQVALGNSVSLEDRGVSIMMDLHIGGMAIPEMALVQR